jgi:hypothetical protein
MLFTKQSYFDSERGAMISGFVNHIPKAAPFGAGSIISDTQEHYIGQVAMVNACIYASYETSARKISESHW